MLLADAQALYLNDLPSVGHDESSLPLKRIDVLGTGYVAIDSWLGSDRSIVAKARKSTGGGNKSEEADRKFIGYLVRNRHTSPIEMAELIFDLRVPIFVARQWVRHRTHAMNEYSGRYAEMPDDFYSPWPERLSPSDTPNKQAQGGVADLDLAEKAAYLIHESQRSAYEEYRELLDLGVQREVARTVLPLGGMTSFYWKQNLHNLLHLLHLRTDPHAQWEIQQVAGALEVFVALLYPWTYEAWREYVRDAVTLSRTEARVFSQCVSEGWLESFASALTADGVPANRVTETLARLRRAGQP